MNLLSGVSLWVTLDYYLAMTTINADYLVGEHIHLLMRRNKITQVELSKELNIAQPSLGRKLFGLRSWTIDELLATAKYFNVPLSDLMPGDDYSPVLSGRGRHVRPEGLEPPTFCFGVNTPLGLVA